LDNGPGIPREFHSQVFEEYFKVPVEKCVVHDGYGLGLSIVKNLMDGLESHDLRFRSIVGRGTRFDIYLPLQAVRQSCVLESKIDGSATMGELIGCGFWESDVYPLFRGAYVLVICDDSSRLEELTTFLDLHGVLIETSVDIEAGVGLMHLAERQFDAIVIALDDEILSYRKTELDLFQIQAGSPIPIVCVPKCWHKSVADLSGEVIPWLFVSRRERSEFGRILHDALRSSSE
jgi:hypothetical protein